MINAGSVQVKLFADTKQYMTAMTAAGTKMKTLGTSAQSFAKVSMVAFAAFTAASAKMATDFDKRLREISTLIIGVTEKDIKNMSREIRDLANTTGKALDDIGKAKYDIISAGFTGAAESAVLLDTATRLAVGGVTSVTNSADLLTSALNAFAKSGFEAESAADILFTTVRLGKTTMDELVGSVGRVFPTAKVLGASLADVGAAMATITAGGIKTYEAATYLNQAFTKLGAPSDSAAEAMRLYGIQVFRTNDGMIDLFSTVKQFKGYDLETMRKFFPEIRAIKAILAMSNNLGFLKRALTDTGNAANATQVAFLKMKMAWSTKMSQSAMQFKDVMIELGNQVMPTVVAEFDNIVKNVASDLPKLSDFITTAVSALGGFLNVLSKTIPILKVATIAMVAFAISNKVTVPLLSMFYKNMIAVNFALASTAPAATMATIAISRFTTAMATNPIGVWIVVIGAAIAAIVGLGIGISKLVGKSKKANKHFDSTKESIMALGLSADYANKKLSKKAGKKGSLLDVDKLNEVATAINEMNKEFATFAVLKSMDFGTFNKSIEDEITRVRNLMSKQPEVVYEGGTITQPFGLDKLELQIRNLELFNKSLKDAGLNTYKYTKDVFDALNINISPFEDSIRALMASNNNLAKMQLAKLPFDVVGTDMKFFIELGKQLVGEKATFEELLSWIENFNKVADNTNGDMLKYMSDSLKSVMATMNSMELKSGVGMTVFLEKQGEMELFDYDEIESNIGEIKKLGDELAQSFGGIADSISSTMAESFTEIVLSGRVAMQELESYNKGLTTSFRTSSEIQEEAWANMWNNIISDTVRALAEILIKYTILTGALLALDAISGGLLRGALGVADSVGGFWGGMADMFKSVGGEGFANTFGKSISDGIVSPNGQIITTDPKDYLIATKTPEDLGVGGGGNVTYNITAMDAKSFEDYLVKNPKALAKGVGHSVERRNLRLKPSGNTVRAEY